MKRINHKDFGIDPIIVEPMNISERKAFWRNEKEKEYTKNIKNKLHSGCDATANFFLFK
jgi:hypothetical protein